MKIFKNLLITWAFVATAAACSEVSDGKNGGAGGGLVGNTGGTTGGGGSSGGSGGSPQGGSVGSGGTPGEIKGIGFERDGYRADPAATATLQDGAIAIINLRASTPGALLISLIQNPGPFKVRSYSCADSASISLSIQGVEYSSEKGGECSVVVTSFSGVGKPLTGTFSAVLKNTSGADSKITDGVFSVIPKAL